MAHKTWFITGTSRGFGRIWTEAALVRGDRVAATARDASSLAPLADRYDDDVLLALELDVTDRQRVFKARRESSPRWPTGRIPSDGSREYPYRPARVRPRRL